MDSIETILRAHLVGIPSGTTETIVRDVQQRWNALVGLACDAELRDAWLFLAMQEALHSTAPGTLHARQLAVAVVRNSRVEDVHSQRLAISDEAMPAFMREVTLAIDALLAGGSQPAGDDGGLCSELGQYKRAIAALAALQRASVPVWKAATLRIPALGGPSFEALTRVGQAALPTGQLVSSGMDNTFPHIAAHLRETRSRSAVFASSGFARISRNPEVVFRTVEACMAGQIPFILPSVFILPRKCRLGRQQPPRLSHTNRESNQAAQDAVEEWRPWLNR